MSARKLKLDPVQAVEEGYVNNFRGYSFPENELNWPKISGLASQCRDQTDIGEQYEASVQQLLETQATELDLAQFWKFGWQQVWDFCNRRHPDEIAFLCKLARFPFGVHNTHRESGLVMPGFKSDLRLRKRFYNPTGWTRFVKNFSLDNQDVELLDLDNCPLPPASLIFDGFRGCDLVDQQNFAVPVLMALVHDRMLYRPVYRDGLEIVFS